MEKGEKRGRRRARARARARKGIVERYQVRHYSRVRYVR